MKEKTHAVFCCGIVAGLLCLSANGAESAGVLSTVGVGGVAGGATSSDPGLSSDGRFVVFLSRASNLVTNKNSAQYLDVFVHDLTTSTTVLATVSLSGVSSGNGDSAYASISSNGQFVAFASTADNLVAGDTNGARDVFVRDLVAKTTARISVGLNGGNAAAAVANQKFALSGNPQISADGRWIVFESSATNLASLPDKNIGTDLFIHDRQTGVTRLVSVNASTNGSGNGASELPSLTQDARRVAFLSYATDLVAGVSNAQGEVYVRDLEGNNTIWASARVAEYLGSTYKCYAPAISADGRAVAFKVSSPFYPTSVFRVDLVGGAMIPLGTNSSTAASPSLGQDGRLLAYDDGTNVFIYDATTGSNALVSVRYNGVGPGNGRSSGPVLSEDASTVVFTSAATDLIQGGSAPGNVMQIFARHLPTGVTRLVTADSEGLPATASHIVPRIVMSRDGARIAFDSIAGSLVAGDLNGESDVFVRDLAAGQTRLASRRANQLPSLTGARDVRIGPDCLSGDGRFLLFARLGNQVLPDESSGYEDLFVRDLTTGVEEQIAVFHEARPKEQVISANGRYVAYVTEWFAAAQTEEVTVYDRLTKNRVVASVSPTGTGFLNGPFRNVALSPNGNLVAYLAGRGSAYDVCLFDVQTGSNRIINVRYDLPQVAVGEQNSPPRFSPDGHWLVFGSESSLLTSNGQFGLFLLDLTATNSLQVIPATNNYALRYAPAFSADSRFAGAGRGVFDLQSRTHHLLTLSHPNLLGRYSLSAFGQLAAYEERSGTGSWNVVAKDVPTGSARSVSINTNFSGGGNNVSWMPAVTPDGKYVIYASRASNLNSVDTSQVSDIYARDLVRGVTILLSKSQYGNTAGDGASTVPVLSANGRTVVFQSFASDLAQGDYNLRREIFIAQLNDVSSDGDDLDDDWEMTYFGTLARNGTGDFDRDGASDRAEFLAGTDPTNLGSIFRVITVTSLGQGTKSILWNAVPGRTYRVQFKSGVEETSWNDLPGEIIATATTGSANHTPPPAARAFYRVVLVR